MARTVTIGRLFGIRLGVHVSWLVVFALLTVALARSVPFAAPAAYALGASCALTLFACVVAHELAHALAARRFAVRTLAITLFLAGGVATLEEEPPSPRADALVALAGPALSAALAAVAFALLLAAERYLPAGARLALSLPLAYLAVANGFLAAFNLIPAYPMDGGRVLRAFLWQRGGDRRAATLLAARVGTGFALLFVAAAVLLVAATHAAAWGWYGVLGAFLLAQSRAQARLHHAPLRPFAEAAA